jgi:hypothetical protein
MDARTLSAATGIRIVTLNAWISRGYVPDIDPDAQGRRRDYDLSAATHVAIMAELIPFGFGAPMASSVAKSATTSRKPCCLITYPLQEEQLPKRSPEASGWTPLFAYTPRYFDSEEDLPEALANLQKTSPGGLLPGAFMIINSQRIKARMRRVEEEWRERRKSGGCRMRARPKTSG